MTFIYLFPLNIFYLNQPVDWCSDSHSEYVRYVSLLGLADSFLNKATPRNVVGAIHCLQSALALPSVSVSPVFEARTHLQLGQMLRKETKNQVGWT